MNRKRILIIDDDPRNIFALTAILKSRSYTCISCNDAKEALRILRDENEEIDVVLMDMMMPDMDGYEAIPLMKKIEHRKNVPIYAVTALAMVGDREKCLAAGADDYVSKPIDVDKLMHLLDKE